MGAWGHGHFEDDAALDFMADIEESANPKDVIKKALSLAVTADYLEADEANAVIVASAYVDRKINGTKFTDVNADDPLDVDTFPERHPEISFEDIRQIAVTALKKVLSEESELNELWTENEEDYSPWRKGVEALLLRLSNKLRIV